MAPFMHYASSVAQQALTDAGWETRTAQDKERTGVCFGSGIGCLEDIAATAASFSESVRYSQGPWLGWRDVGSRLIWIVSSRDRD